MVNGLNLTRSWDGKVATGDIKRKERVVESSTYIDRSYVAVLAGVSPVTTNRRQASLHS